MAQIKTTTKKKRISSTTVNFIILFLMVIILGAGLYFFYYFYLQIKAEEIKDLSESRADLTVKKVVKDIKLNELINNGFYELKQHGVMEYGEQLSGVPTSLEFPLAPENIKVINPQIGNELIIMWQKPEHALFEKVNIYRSEKFAKLGTVIATDMAPSGHFVDEDVKNNVQYYYLVRSSNGTNESENQEQTLGMPTDITPPFPPQNVVITDTEESKIKITWENPIGNDFAYARVYRSEIRGEKGNVVGDNITDNIYEDKNIKDGKDYYYIVTSVDEAGNESSNVLVAPPSGNPLPFGSEKEEVVVLIET